MCLTTTTTTATYVKLESSTDGEDRSTKQAEKNGDTNKVLTTAPPPWHSVALLVFFAALFGSRLPSGDQLDQVATLATFAHTQPWIGTCWNLGLIRLAIAATIWATTWQMVKGPGWTTVTIYPNGSQLKQGVSLEMKGIKTLFPFTSWCWNLLGVSYTLNGLIALSVATEHYYDHWIGNLPHNWLLRMAVMAWEVSAPCAILVSAVVRYAIWEMDVQNGADTTTLKSVRNLMMHNANSFFVLAEVALLGGLPVRLSDMSLAPLFGVAYVLFSWSMSCRWTDAEHGPQFLYFFFDTTLGKAASLSLLALLCAQLLFYVLFAYAQVGLDLLSQAIGSSQEDDLTLAVGHVGFVALVCAAVCRFRD